MKKKNKCFILLRIVASVKYILVEKNVPDILSCCCFWFDILWKKSFLLDFEVKVSILSLSLSLLLQSIRFPGGEEYDFKKTET